MILRAVKKIDKKTGKPVAVITFDLSKTKPVILKEKGRVAMVTLGKGSCSPAKGVEMPTLGGFPVKFTGSIGLQVPNDKQAWADAIKKYGVQEEYVAPAGKTKYVPGMFDKLDEEQGVDDNDDSDDNDDDE